MRLATLVLTGIFGGIGSVFGYRLPRGLSLGSEGIFPDRRPNSGKRRGRMSYLLPAGTTPSALTFAGGGDMGTFQVTVSLTAGQ